MRKLITSREVRDLLFALAAIVLSVVVCVASISQGTMLGIVVSIILLSVLCVAFGYIYCKYEENIFASCENEPKESDNPKNPKEVKKQAEEKAEIKLPEAFKEAVAEVVKTEKNDIDKKKIV